MGLPDPTESRELLYYVDASMHWHVHYVDPNLPPSYIDAGLVGKEGEEISYADPSVTVWKGIDVSYHNGDIDWERVRDDGISFAFLRLGYRGYGAEGTLNLDPKFHEYLAGAHAAGLRVGVYLFSQAINEKEALEEADLVLRELNGETLELPVVYDPESIPSDSARTDAVSGQQFTRNTEVFCEAVKNGGYQPMVYSNMNWEDHVFDLSRLTSYPLWYADYEAAPQSPYWFSCWQYAEDGHVDGVDGEVDLDVWFQ